MVLPFLPDRISSESAKFISNNLYAGITDQIGQNAFYISVGISIISAKLIIRPTKISLNVILLICLIITALLLTGKRGLLLSNIVAMIGTILVYAKVHKKRIMKGLLKSIMAITFLILIIIIVIPEDATPFMRFVVKDEGDITSGRIILYIVAIELFKQKPILGWESGCFSYLNGIDTHNVYLQLLCENGVLGALFFVTILLYNF
jgi:O-antigen ligase